MSPETEQYLEALKKKRAASIARKRAKQEDPACERHCTKCWAPRDRPDRKLCAKCREYVQQYQQKRSAKNRAAGKCACGRDLLSGYKACEVCRARSADKMRKRTARRKAQGLCIQCGKEPALYMRSSCDRCLSKNALRTRRYLGCEARVTYS